jgi:uncharacterized membrane protein YfcA
MWKPGMGDSACGCRFPIKMHRLWTSDYDSPQAGRKKYKGLKEKMNMTVLIFATFLSFIIKGMSGFANTIVFNSITSFAADNVNISPLELLIGYPSNLVIAWKERKSISIKECLPLILFLILGSVPGVFILKTANAKYIKVFLGVVIILFGIEMLLRECAKKKRKSSKAVLAIIGIITGLLCGMFGIGALTAAYMSRTTTTSSQFKGNMCLVFVVENTIRVVVYALSGLITYAVIKTALLMMPIMLIGLALGMQLSKAVDEKLAKQGILLLLIISGASLILSNL